VLSADPDNESGDELIVAIAAIHKTISALGLNTNEELALHALLLKCPPLSSLTTALQTN